MSASLPVDLPETPVNRTQLLKYMKACGFKTVTVDHPPLFTVDDSQNLRGALEGGHTKNLFLKDRKGNHFLPTAQEDSVVNLKTLHKLLGGSGKFSFGSKTLCSTCDSNKYSTLITDEDEGKSISNAHSIASNLI